MQRIVQWNVIHHLEAKSLDKNFLVLFLQFNFFSADNCFSVDCADGDG
ncbi:hypothetical protein T06_2182 [Trichinella sp. T6]|nr:hypothetical protein T06_2182 [Trichinella sp. T6]